MWNLEYWRSNTGDIKKFPGLEKNNGVTLSNEFVFEENSTEKDSVGAYRKNYWFTKKKKKPELS